MRVVVLGCGFHGRGIAYELAAADGVNDLVVVDRDGARAKRVAERTGAQSKAFDVTDGAKLSATVDGAGLVFNAVGPYHRSALSVISSAIEKGVPYADMSDDHEVAEALFLDPGWDERARDAKVAVLTGLGMAPGLTGILARLGHERLGAATRVSIRFVWNYSLNYPAAIQHFLRINSGLAPQFIDGAHSRPGAFAGRGTIGFLDPVGDREVYFTGVTDPVTIPRALPGVREVTTKGAFLQPEANAFLEAMVRWGMTDYEPIGEADVSPMEFLMGFVTSPEGAPRFDIPPLELPMAVQVEVEADGEGPTRRVIYEAHDLSRRASTSTAALAALMVARGETDFVGVRAPEGCIEPGPFLRRLMAAADTQFFDRTSGAREPLEV